MKRKERSIGARVFNALCTIGLLSSGIYVLIAGFHFIAVTALVCAAAGIATPILLSGDGILDLVTGIFEAILDGVMAILEAIASIFSGLLG